MVRSVAVVAALFATCLCLTAGSATAAGFTKCGPRQKLQNNGIFGLREKESSCKIARQVAYGYRGGDTSPRGFTCTAGTGGNLTPYTCIRTASVIKFSLEG